MQTTFIYITHKIMKRCMCLGYHPWRVSVLESKIQLLTRWTAAQYDGKDVLRRDYMACIQLWG